LNSGKKHLEKKMSERGGEKKLKSKVSQCQGPRAGKRWPWASGYSSFTSLTPGQFTASNDSGQTVWHMCASCACHQAV